MSSVLALIGWIVACELVGMAGGAVTQPGLEKWYRSLEKPPGTPPNFVFPVVWTTLFAMMGVAGWAITRDGFGAPGVPLALGFFAAQLVLNFLWSTFFFGLRNPTLALFEIALLWAAVALTALLFGAVVPWAGWLLVPYLAWVSYAAYLNAGIVWLNR